MSTTPTPVPQPSKLPAPPGRSSTSSSASKLIEAQNEARRQNGPNLQKKQTYCNDATFCIARRMGAPPRALGDAHGDPYTADQMAHNLASSTEYRDVTPEQAQQLANQGDLVIGAWFNPQRSWPRSHGQAGGCSRR